MWTVLQLFIGSSLTGSFRSTNRILNKLVLYGYLEGVKTSETRVESKQRVEMSVESVLHRFVRKITLKDSGDQHHISPTIHDAVEHSLGGFEFEEEPRVWGDDSMGQSKICKGNKQMTQADRVVQKGHKHTRKGVRDKVHIVAAGVGNGRGNEMSTVPSMPFRTSNCWNGSLVRVFRTILKSPSGIREEERKVDAPFPSRVNATMFKSMFPSVHISVECSGNPFASLLIWERARGASELDELVKHRSAEHALILSRQSIRSINSESKKSWPPITSLMIQR
ncbi:hypothetical protein BLNAU_21213 [Blattamonas nauphoetae]|uniref:Uncharacterized protein n=1 Tax=Blattamonas nauphoetae TaxID=2049346 RepID=A0ABQ9WWH9_9EUKA|nr:hypothetical protein BLNAU_21213 [Blattamonas nauphoetae]